MKILDNKVSTLGMIWYIFLSAFQLLNWMDIGMGD